MKKMRGKRTAIGVLALGIMLLGAVTAQAETWTGLGDGVSFEDVDNWNTTNAFPDTTRDISGVFTVERSVDVTCNRTFIKNGAVLNINGGSHSDGQSGASIFNFLGDTGAGTLNVSNGTYNIGHGLRIGTGGGTGDGKAYVVGGSLLVTRGSNSKMEPTNPGGRPSIEIGDSNGGVGLLEISGGSMQTRGGAHIAQDGTFSVIGSAPTVIGIGLNGSGDGSWIQNGTLKTAIDSGGVTKILVHDDNGDGVVTADLRAGSFLEPSFVGGHIETNAWIILEVEGTAGVLINSGIALAAGVDSLWSFGVTNNPVDEVDVLWVGYAGAEYIPPELPEYTTNMYVDAVVPVSDTWNLFAPEGGDTALSNQSSSGFTATIGTVTNSDYRPAVAQEFPSDLDISQIGQAVTINFDVELLDLTVGLDTGFRFALYDTNTNYQMTLGMLDTEAPSGSSMRMRFDPEVSSTNFFVPGDYSHLCGGGGTLASAAGGPGSGLSFGGGVNHIEASVTRTGTNELEVVTTWTDGGTNTLTCSLTFDELTNPDDVPPGGKWNQLNGFGFKLYSSAPFTAGTGSYEVSNLELSYTVSLPDGFGYNVSDITVESSGDVILTLSDPYVGATYEVVGTVSLLPVSWDPIGSYVAEAPGIITIPAADAASYKFFDVALPVTTVIE